MGFVKGIINAVADPRLFFILAFGALIVVLWKREEVASNAAGYGVLGFLGAFFLFGTFDPNFRLIVTKPDNVPIVGLIFLLVFFVWYSVREGESRLFRHIVFPAVGVLALVYPLWATADGGVHWAAQANPNGNVAVSCLAFAPGGEPFGVAPLLDGLALRTDDGRTWRSEEIRLNDLTPAAAVVDPGRAYVLGRGGRVARYTDPRFKPRP